MKIKATKIGQDTVLSQIVNLVEDAKTGKAKMQKMVDQVAKYFVPAVIAIAVVTGLAWYFVGGIGVDYALLAFVSVIIIACPCALGIATPAALMMGSGKGAENGILFKGGEYLEIAKKVNTIVFDKTGTVTEGRPSVTDIVDLSGMGQTELLRLVAIAEAGSEHPLSKAVVRKAKESGLIVQNPDSFEAIVGHGLRATYAEHIVLIGNRNLMEQNYIAVAKKVDDMMKSLEMEGKTATLASINGRLAGIIAISDTVKDTAKEAIEILKKNHLEVIMLTGDNERTANAIASKIGIDKAISQVLPNQKEQVIADFVSSFRVLIKEKFDLEFGYEDIREHDLYKLLGISEEETLELIISTFDYNLDTQQDAVESIRKLSSNHEIVLVTARPEKTEEITKKMVKIKRN